ncbi:hypothetical protein K443DRAFT_33362, partial [Laccaria amethystina LaAM-08-1]
TLQKRFTNSNNSFTRLHRNDGRFRRNWLLRASPSTRTEDTADPLVVVEDSHWAKILSVTCTKRLSFIEVFDNDGHTYRPHQSPSFYPQSQYVLNQFS